MPLLPQLMMGGEASSSFRPPHPGLVPSCSMYSDKKPTSNLTAVADSTQTAFHRLRVVSRDVCGPRDFGGPPGTRWVRARDAAQPPRAQDAPPPTQNDPAQCPQCREGRWGTHESVSPPHLEPLQQDRVSPLSLSLGPRPPSQRPVVPGALGLAPWSPAPQPSSTPSQLC